MQNEKIILGTVQFGLNYGINNVNEKPSETDIKNILDCAFNHNINLLDTAEAYGNAQEVIGIYHQNSSNKFNVITKYSNSKSDLPTNLIERVKYNIKTLNVDQLYCYMFHSYTDFESYYPNFQNDIIILKKQGLIQKFGVSVYTNKEIEELLKYDIIDVIQLPFNLLDNSKQRSSTLKKIKAKGIEIHTRSVFLQGLFFKDANTLSEKIQPIKNDLKTINNLAKINGIEIADLALNYVHTQDLIDKILIGVDNVDQLNKNLKALNSPISSEILNKIDNLNVENKLLLNPSNWN